IARAFIHQTPFEVWGDGTQIRNWTYVDDIVEGTILAGEKIDDGTAVNLGTMERIRVIDAVNMVCENTGHKAEIKLRKDMPTGPLSFCNIFAGLPFFPGISYWCLVGPQFIGRLAPTRYALLERGIRKIQHPDASFAGIAAPTGSVALNTEDQWQQAW